MTEAKLGSTPQVRTASRPKSGDIGHQVREDTFAKELRRVIELARASTTTTQAPGTDGVTGEAEAVPAWAAAHEVSAVPRMGMLLELSKLDGPIAMKLAALLLAGRDARDIGGMVASLEREQKFWFSAHVLGEDYGTLADHLQRAEAIAHATAFDLEAPIASWGSVAVEGLHSRVWSSFGRQLARSEPSEWSCFATGDEKVHRLYLRLPDKGWWSFCTVLDRPSAAAVRRAQARPAQAKHRWPPLGPLENVIGLPVARESRILRRALRAIRARLGIYAEGGTA